MDPIVGLLSALLPSECVASYFPSGSLLAPAFDALLDVPCAKLVISKVLGYGIVVGSAGVKLPQVYNIVKAGSVDGLSGSSILIEWAASVSSFAYFMGLGYPFSTWGENFFLFFQQGFIAALYLRFTYGLRSAQFAATTLLSAAVGAALYLRSLPDIAAQHGKGQADHKECGTNCGDGQHHRAHQHGVGDHGQGGGLFLDGFSQ